MASFRPRKSGGLPRKASLQIDLHKRMPKDDVFFNAEQQKHRSGRRISQDDINIRSRMATASRLHLPDHASILTPEHSPGFPVLHQVLSVPIRMQTPESTASGDTPVGMALGSPTRYPPPDVSKWQAQVPFVSPDTATLPETPLGAADSKASMQRRRPSRRKLLGLFGGAKKKEEMQGLAQGEAGENSKSAGTLGRTKAASTSSVSVFTKLPTPKRCNTQAEETASKHRPVAIRSNTMPHDVQEPFLPSKGCASPSSRSKAIGPRLHQAAACQRSPANDSPAPSFLDVQIPDTKLERFSVMFSDVLRQGPKQDLRASLLSRRQATVQRLKTINNNSIGVEDTGKERSSPRGVTSPPSAASPQLSLFPTISKSRASPVSNYSPSGQSFHSRSSTSPGRLPSPTQAVFSKQPQAPAARKQIHGNTLAVPSRFENSPTHLTRASSPAKVMPIYPTDTSFNFGSDQPSIERTPNSKSREIVISQPQPVKPTPHKPQWQMASPQSASGFSTSPSGQSSTFSSDRRRSPSTASSATTHTPTTKPSSEIDDVALALNNAVEISIARQISVSQQQRQLLGALGNSAATSPLGVKIVRPQSTPRRLGDEQLIKETKSSLPKVINPRENPFNPVHLAQNRKSSLAVVEGD